MTATRTGVHTTSWRWIAAIWCAGALFDASQTVLIMHAEGRHIAWLPLFATELVSWLPWALATPLVIHLARRYPIVRGMSVRTLSVHLAAFAAISAVSETWFTVLQMLFNPWHNRKWPTFVDTWTTTLIFQVLTFLIAYALILTVTYVVDARESMARQLTETARLNEELSKAQLAALRRQLEPHFMYNTLNSIAGLVRDQRNDAAVSMIVGLSEFLRRSSEDSHRSQVALQEEVEYLQRYLDIQKVRFGERLQVNVDIPEKLLRAKVPNLLLQPLVENAIKHGIAKRVAGGTVRVAGVCHNGNLCLSVYNDGPTLPTDWEATRTGVGIGNLRTRLQILHGGESGLQLRSADPGGVEVVVTLPYREA
ncbi:MAG TPA: histidine kinase [Steroidobacteraceae bacterium]|nr:histidine kinase [Steroidobacteraceae bacterium]